MKKHILLIADGRSAITKRWISILKELNYKVSLVSTYPNPSVTEVHQIYILPVAFSATTKSKVSSTKYSPKNFQNNWKTGLIHHTRPFLMRIRYLLGPGTLKKYQKELVKIIQTVNPDLVHALRIPYEGMLATAVPKDTPLLVSIWGNDFTLHARANTKMGKFTRRVMERANGVLADVHRDITLAHQWGLSHNKPTIVVPGGGGINIEEIQQTTLQSLDEFNLPQDAPIIINPRGIRAYAKTDTFFKAIPKVVEEYPNAIFLCPGMKGKPEAENWVNKLSIHKNVRLLDTVSQHKLWSLFHRCQLTLSITTHDGTPNTLIEAMACNCFPIAGDINSIREWIIPGINGILVDPHNPNDLANAILLALSKENLRNQAKLYNHELIKSKAEVTMVQEKLSNYYSIFL